MASLINHPATWGATVVVVVLASAYSQHQTHALLVNTLEMRIASLEKQLEDRKEGNRWQPVVLALERIRLEVEGARADVKEALETTEHQATVRHLREMLQYSKREGYELRRAKEAGFSFEEVYEALDSVTCTGPYSQNPNDYHVNNVRCLRRIYEAGYTEVCTEFVGLRMQEYGLTVDDMRAACCQNRQMADGSCLGPVLEKLRADGYPFVNATAAGFNVQEAKQAGYTCAEAHAILFEEDPEDILLKYLLLPDQLKAENKDQYIEEELLKLFNQYMQSAKQLCSTDEVAEILKKANYTENLPADSWVLGIYTPAELSRAGYELEDIARAKLEEAEAEYQKHRNVQAFGFKRSQLLAQLKAAGITCAQARALSFRPRECKAAGFTFLEAKAAGYAYFELHWNRGDEAESKEHNGWEE